MDLSKELSVNEKFEYIVEDPFYSNIHKCVVKVDDHSNMFVRSDYATNEYTLHFEGLTDGMIDVLFTEWKRHQKFMDNISEVGVNTI